MSASALYCSGSTLVLSTPALRFRSKNHGSVELEARRKSLPIQKGSVTEERLPEGWGRLSLVCPSENPGAPPVNQSSKLKTLARSATRKLLLQETVSLPSLNQKEGDFKSSGDVQTPTGVSNCASGDTIDGINMSGASGSTLRRGIKATTSKLMSATSVVKRPSAIPATFERTAGVTERGDPGRFVEGVSFKGKLIGVLEVAEARGDRMCQEALAELKVAVRAAGEHKQRIVINVAMDGIRLTDERTGDCLYHHPVHKISFIAQDMTDTRAFGYIFGSPDAGHKFFGIKTEKASSQVVIAMRDLFQVVFEKKKKEIEKARAQLEEGRDGSEFKDSAYGSFFGTNGEPGIVSASLTSGARGAIADLLDLQSELTSLQRGLSEISKRAQSSAHKQQQQPKDDSSFDPFGDSFKSGSSVETTSVKSRSSANVPQTAPAPLAPPPTSCRSRHDSHPQKLQGSFSSNKSTEFVKFPVDFKNINHPSSQADSRADRYAALSEMHLKSEDPANSVYSDDMSSGHRMSVGSAASTDSMVKEEFETQWSMADRHGNISHHSGQGYDIFTELDPLGTGKNKPFVDKKDFFNDVRKATARRILREMGDGEESLSGSPRVLPGTIPVEVSALVASSSLYSSSANPSTVNCVRQPSTSTHATPIHGSTLATFSDSFNPTHDSLRDSSGPQSLNKEHPENCSGFADFNQFTDSPKSQRSDFSGSNLDEPPASLSVGSLTVALPPESFRDSPPPFSPPPPPPHSTSGSSSPVLQRYSPVPRSRLGFIKQTTIASSSLSPKTLPRNHKFNKQLSYEMEWESQYLQSPRYGYAAPAPSNSIDGPHGISPRPRPRAGLTKHLSSSSATLPLRSRNQIIEHSRASQNEHGFSAFSKGASHDISYEEAPEPPPRPAHVEPPPLPPKRLPSHVTLKPPPRPPPSSESHYNYINEFDSSPDDNNAAKSPPIPIPVRKPRHQDFYSSGRIHRSTEELFQFPLASHSPTKEYSGTMPKISSRGSTPSKCSTPRGGLRSGADLESVDLANTSLDQLAAKLNVPVEQLAKMTVVELAACLAQLQMYQDREETPRPQSGEAYEVPLNFLSSTLHSSDHSHRHMSPKSNREWEEVNKSSSFDQDDSFANFDAQFPKSPENDSSFNLSMESKFPLGAPVSEDRYAVFRELTVTAKQKSIFDENFLTPQNSMEDEVSEVSSGTFKANFADSYRQDSIELKSSISDELDTADNHRNKEWEAAAERIDHECVTVFRSPDISEYENFEPNFDCKFDDNFSSSTLNEQNFNSITSPGKLLESHPNSIKHISTTQISPFTDDFSKVTNVIISTTCESKFGKIPSEEKFVANFNIPSSECSSKFASFQEVNSRGRLSTSEKSPFEDDFADFHLKPKVEDSGFISNPETEVDRYDNVFDSDSEKKGNQNIYFQRTHKKVKTKRSSSSLSAPNTASMEKSQSPFEDDFSQRTCKYEVLRDLDAERDSSVDGELSRLSNRDKDAASPFEDRSWQGSPRHTPYDDQKSIGSLQSIQEEARKMESPFEESLTPTSRKTSFDHDRISRSGSEPHRKSPYSENLTPTPPCYPNRNVCQARVSVGSECSLDVRQSPFEDNFNPVIETNVKDTEPEKNSLPLAIQNGEEESSADFADFENAFQRGEIVFDKVAELSAEPNAPSKLCSNNIEIKLNEQSDKPIVEEDEDFPDPVAEFKVSARIPKAAEVETNIFRRSSDPFSDEFFDAELSENKFEKESTSVSVSKDPFWDENFDNFKFNNV